MEEDKLICPQCGSDELEDLGAGHLQCRACGHEIELNFQDGTIKTLMGMSDEELELHIQADINRYGGYED
jgi:ribosomal protein L37AE/L43A